uniref:RNA-dependent RNA polymerase n=1 Tax=Diaporthe gulyae magoulivirus 1 TaxID=3077424 RepID=A0AA96K8D9_9VIRU|nr:MAG: RNA-dependent RNA polymerase [Diaporthe gulyae magoulivirus 1]
MVSVISQPVTSARVVDLLHAVCRVWSEHSGVTLQIPPHLQVSDPRQLKEFCVGLLEKPTTHPWYKDLQAAEERRALSVAGSLFLFRKCLPAEWSEAEMCQKHRSLLVPACRSERSPLPADYIAHVKRITAQEFPPGWDSSYRAHCWSATTSVGACLDSPRSAGGVRALRLDRPTFLRRVLGDEYFEVSNTVKYKVVPTGGKGRGVTVADKWMAVLSPLHRTAYDHMTKSTWLLRGEAKPGRFRKFLRKEGEVFVSGDYESASDNLRVEVADAIIDVMQSSSKRIPSTIWETARRFLRCKVLYPDIEIPMESEGQMMGNLFCFPLLCLQNYIAFRYIMGAEVPVRVNGDDIVFRSSREDYDRWASFVSSVGLVLSRGKTLVSEKFFSLNSSFFWSRRNRPPRPVPVTRVACFTKPFEDWGALSGSFRSFTRGFGGSARLEAEAYFLRFFRSRIRQAGRSVTRGLSVPASVVALQRAGLWRREQWFFESVPESQDSLPVSPSRLKWGAIPAGWKRVPAGSCLLTGKVSFVAEGATAPEVVASADDLQKAFWAQLVSRTWLESPTRGVLLDEYRENVLRTGRERDWKAWVSRPKKLIRRRPDGSATWVDSRLMQAFQSKKRCSRAAFDKYRLKPRVQWLWAPVEEVLDESGEEDLTWVRDLVEWECLSFWPPHFELGLREQELDDLGAD